jgi:hypothetical protein
MHLDEHQVQSLADGELSPSATASARDHMARCDDCRRRVAEAQRAASHVEALLRELDHPAPRVGAASIAAEARARDLAVWRRAAGFLLAAGLIGVAYAAPGSPVPTWVHAVIDWAGGARGRAPHIVAPTPSVGGIAVAPGANLVVVFETPQASGSARVIMTDGAEVVVRAVAGAATFTADAGRLVIDNRGSAATFEIEIPRAAPRVEIRVGETQIFLKQGAQVTPGTVNTNRPFVLPLAPRAPGANVR